MEDGSSRLAAAPRPSGSLAAVVADGRSAWPTRRVALAGGAALASRLDARPRRDARPPIEEEGSIRTRCASDSFSLVTRLEHRARTRMHLGRLRLRGGRGGFERRLRAATRCGASKVPPQGTNLNKNVLARFQTAVLALRSARLEHVLYSPRGDHCMGPRFLEPVAAKCVALSPVIA